MEQRWIEEALQELEDEMSYYLCEGGRKMEQRLKKIFDLDRIRAFTEAHIDQTEYIEDVHGEKRKVLVIETLVSGAHGAYIPGLVLEMFGQAEEYDLEDPYNWEKNEWICEALEDLENEINDYLNNSLPSKGIYYMGFHEYDGSYCLFYEEYEDDTKTIEVIVIEAGPDYLDQLERFEMELPEDKEQAVAEAIRAVRTLGYTVIPNDQGGCNTYASNYDRDYIAITVAPGIE